MAIIYKATNKINGKAYVGYTSRTLQCRKTQHIYEALKNKLKVPFHHAIRKYGVDAFDWEILKENAALDDEIKLIEQFNTYTNGYNCTQGGDGTTGISCSDEKREKHRQISTKMWEDRSPEERQEISLKVSKANKGKNVSEETRTKLAENAKKQFSTPEARQAVSERNKKNGNIPPSQKGMLWWNNGTEHKQSKNCPGVDWVRGRLSWYSDEAKKKMSESAKKRVRNGRSSNPIIL